MMRPSTVGLLGIYDSGVGGLSVLRHLWRLLPATPVLYVADSGRAPYGERTAPEIVSFGVEIARHLQGRGAKALVVACNTSSSVAMEQVQDAFEGPVVGMLHPAGMAAARRWGRAGPVRRVGVLATATTTRSGAYVRALTAHAPHLEIVVEPCPEWVPLVEAGELEGERAEDAVRLHVGRLLDAGVEGLVLGCTHYPFLLPQIRRALAAAPHVEVLDPGEAVAEEAARVVAGLTLAGRGGDEAAGGTDRFVTSGDPDRFRGLFDKLVGAEHRDRARRWGGVEAIRWRDRTVPATMQRVSELPATWRDVRVAVVGLGVENLPLVRFLVARGASVVASDRKRAGELGRAAGEVEALGIRTVLGEDYLTVLQDADVAFLTPGIPKHLPEIEAARRAGVLITGQTDLFLRTCRAPVVGITGSSGKTTTTSLVGQMLKGAGRPVFVGGNIGEPLIGHLDSIPPAAWVVLELSSFQLETAGVSPHVAVVTNITPNHLDVHPTMDAYVAAKERILAFQRVDDFAILNAESELVAGMAGRGAGRVMWFGHVRRQPGAWVEGERLMASLDGAGEPVEMCRRSDIRLRGEHNVENMLAAGLTALVCGAPVEAIRETARSFTGVAHRLEPVGRLDGVLYVNDSIATSPARAIAGLRSFTEPIVLIAGGYDKHLPFDEFAQVAAERCRHVVLLGQTAPAIARALRQAQADLAVTFALSLEEAVRTAREVARPGDVVLLSPACASYDMFRNFEERGSRFRELVGAMRGDGHAEA